MPGPEAGTPPGAAQPQDEAQPQAEAAQAGPGAFAPELALARAGLAFAEALAEVALAETQLSATAMARAAGLGLAALLALGVTWLLGTIAAIFALHAWLGSPALAFAIVALLHALLAVLALRQRAAWRARVGYARTRAALAAALAEPDKDAS